MPDLQRIFLIIIILSVLTIISFVVCIICAVKCSKLKKSVMETNNEARFQFLEKKINNISVSAASGENPHSLRKVGIVKYDAFPGITGSYSFSTAILDGENSGIILTSLFGHETCSTYLREVRNGKTSVPLSKEEQTALIRAVEKF